MKSIIWLKEQKYLILILLIGAFLRFYHIDFQSVWLDEIHTLNESNPDLSLAEMYASLSASDPHPPLYFILVQLFFKIFGYTTFVMRSFSAIMGVFGLVALYVLGKELMNKKVACIAIGLLAVNYFHIHYSQDARMYAMMFTTTAFSFYFLIRFIKRPSLKTALCYGVFAALMIYTHFFALFTLFSQYLILLFFVLKPFQSDRKRLFFLAGISGITTFLLYIPALQLFFEATKRTSIWIPMPTVDVYTQIFKDFFGHSEIVLFLISLLIIYFIVKLFHQKNNPNFTINPNTDKFLFSFMLIFIWVFVSLLIPLVSSFVNLPMIINRYFITILPAIILMIAIGMSYVKNNMAKGLILSLIIIFSLTDILIVKKYYRVVSKAQFREATSFIKENNQNNEIIVSSLGWYLPFFLKKDNEHQKIVNKSLEDYISEMQSDTTKIRSFWYFDGHDRTFTSDDQTLVFLNEHFFIENNYDGFQAWTKHFVLLKDAPKTIDISKYEDLKNTNGDSFVYNIESLNYINDIVEVSGWAFFENQESKRTRIKIVLIKEEASFAIGIQTQNVIRRDVTKHFKKTYDLDYSGFNATINLINLASGTYKIALFLKNEDTKKEGLMIIDELIVK